MNESAHMKSKNLVPPPSCPRCSSEYVTRVSLVGFSEHLISLFYIDPFRCQLCGHRFKVLQRGVTYTRIEEDRREYVRWGANFPVTFTVDGTAATGSIIDISLGGCAFHTDAPLMVGIILQLGLQLSREIPPVNIEAAVIRSVRSGRASVEFLRIKRGERDRLKEFIRNFMFSQINSNDLQGGCQAASLTSCSRSHLCPRKSL